MKQALLSSIFFFLFLSISSAQDFHFTQFYASPINLNPALTGTISGKYRLSAIYRSQWGNVLETPRSTYSGAADFRFPIQKFKQRYRDAAGLGILFNSDNFGFTGVTNNQMFLSGAFHKSLNASNDQFLTIGGQFGIAQVNVNYSDLSFQDQFNGRDGYTFGTFEILPENNFAYTDFNVGINYSYAPEEGLRLFVGAAMSHILTPQVSFFFNEEEEETSYSNTLFRKYTVNLSLDLPLSENIYLSPRLLAQFQGPHLATTAGTNFRFLLNEASGTALHLGGWVRLVGNDDDSISPETAVILLGIEYSNLIFGFSYDMNLDDLSTTRIGQGAFEFSVAYLGAFENEIVVCPKF